MRDELLRIAGMGSVLLFGAGDYAMRIWLNPQQLAARSMSANEVVAAVREQKAQVAAGVVGAPPAPSGNEFQLPINTKGRLTSVEELPTSSCAPIRPAAPWCASRMSGGSR